MSDIKDKERRLAELEVDDEIESKKVSIAQKKAQEAEARKVYGRDWKKILGVVKSLKPDMETVHTLYGQGIGHLRKYNDPGSFRPPGVKG